MDKKVIAKLVGVSLAFFVLGYGYLFFQEQTLLSSGKSNSDVVIQMIADSDIEGVKAKLAEFVGDVDPELDQDYLQALVGLDYVAGLAGDGTKITFSEGRLGTSGDDTVYTGSYTVPAVQGGEDYFLIVMRRNGSSWELANTQLSATDPFTE